MRHRFETFNGPETEWILHETATCIFYLFSFWIDFTFAFWYCCLGMSDVRVKAIFAVIAATVRFESWSKFLALWKGNESLCCCRYRQWLDWLPISHPMWSSSNPKEQIVPWCYHPCDCLCRRRERDKHDGKSCTQPCANFSQWDTLP